ncbi:unnamed protein product [Wuchereria bancrofti]|uniref:Uncharacterized protein n=1 Tax=Wuchereria bancrofti TaxID=6293 RepID=A0A3P7DZF8_WUCBA|nr:unnamed protein product [Wuchereria bancrofti]
MITRYIFPFAKNFLNSSLTAYQECVTVPLDPFSCRLQKRRPSVSVMSTVVGAFVLNLLLTTVRYFSLGLTPKIASFDLIPQESFFSFDFENPPKKQISCLESNDNKDCLPLNSKTVAFELSNDNKDCLPLNSKTVAFELVKASMKLVKTKWF